MTRKHGVEVYPHVVERALDGLDAMSTDAASFADAVQRVSLALLEPTQPWCARCNLPEDICRGHDADDLAKALLALDAMQECELAAVMVRADEYAAEGFHMALGMALEAVRSPRYVGDAAGKSDWRMAASAAPAEWHNPAPAAAVTVPLSQISIGADAIPADVATALMAQHSADWCIRLIDELLALMEVKQDAARHQSIWDAIEAQLRVTQ